MKNFILSICAVALFALSSCDKYDDGPLSNRVENLENRVKSLEEQCKQLNTNVTSIQTLVNAMENGDAITSVTPIKEGEKEVGYTFAFVKSPSISVYHGKDGQDGVNGINGADGTNGSAPVIGIKQDEKGDYYWTINGEWILSEDGNKVGTTGTSDVVLPEFKIDKDNWLMSADGGKTWVNLGKGTADGKNAVFNDIDTSDPQKVTFTLSDGTKFTLPRQAELTIKFDEQTLAELKSVSPNSTYNISYVVEGSVVGLKLEVISSGNVKAKLNNRNSAKGTISIITGDAIDEYDKVILLASNGKVTVMSSISFGEEDFLQVTSGTTYQVPKTGGTVSINLETNTDFDLSIPDEDKHWVSKVESRTHRQETITLLIRENKDVARTSHIQLVDKDGNAFTSIEINQGNGKEEEFLKVTSGETYQVPTTGGSVSINIETNTDYSLSIPTDVKSWISTVESRANRKETITLLVSENNGDARSATIQIVDKTGKAFTSIKISQEEFTFSIPSDMTIAFPDENFRSYVLSNFDKDKDGVISGKEALNVTRVSCGFKSIKSLEGIQYFKNLNDLSCYYNQLTSLDLSNNTALTNLECYSNQLTSLDLSNNTVLTNLKCSSNKLTSLDVSGFKALIELDCSFNHSMTSLDVSGCTSLTKLDCNSTNDLRTLDVSSSTALTYLNCYFNKLTSLDVSNNTVLNELNCEKNQLTSLDVKKNTTLKKLNCGNNKLTTLDVSNNTMLTELDCHLNKLTMLDVFKNTSLTKLVCGNNQLTSLDITRNTALIDLECYSNQLTILNVSDCTMLKSLDCNDNQLSSLDVSRNTLLSKLNCDKNKLSTLDVSNNMALTFLRCYLNNLTLLNISKNEALTELHCDMNQLTSLDVTSCTALSKLYCLDNKLTTLDLSKNTALTDLYCSMSTLNTLYLKSGITISNMSKGNAEIIYVD